MIDVIRERLSRLPLLFRPAVVGGVLLAGMVFAFLISRLEHPELPLLLAAFPLLGLILYRYGRIEHGVLGIVLVAATIRYGLPTGTQSRIPVSMVVTVSTIVVWVIGVMVTRKRLRLAPSPTNIPLLGFVAASVVSFIWGNVFRDVLVVPWRSWPFVQLGGLAVMVLLPGAFLLAANHLGEVRWISLLVLLLLVIGTIYIFGDRLHLPVRFLQVRPLFPMWMICLSYTLAITDRKLPLWVRGLLLILAGAWGYHVFIQKFRWLSAWLPSGAAILVISLLRSRMALVILLLIAVLYVGFNIDAIEARLEAERTESGETRLDAWLHNWRVTSKHWLFGVGPAGYALYYMSYFPTEAMATHSNYIDILSQTGVVGLTLFLWFFLAVGFCAWRLWRRVRKRGDFVEAFSLATLGGWVGAMLAMALGDWLVPFVYTQTIAGFDYASYTWVLLGAMVALYVREYLANV
ncbi:MAG TPA: hypothetical protein EYP77_10170 [Anaerolineae bacterium]|nr:hypothetical protein [Anaerolineae bacterium]